MLDPETMRATLGGVAAVVLILFYVGVYRPTRSGFSGWWSLALLCAGASTSLLLFNGTDLQVFANPASSVFGVLGATCLWFAMRSLRRKPLPLWLLAAAGAAILVPVLLQDPADNIWAGNGPLFLYIGLLFGAGAVEMWLAWSERRASRGGDTNREAQMAYFVVCIAGTGMALFYVTRSVLYYTVGPRSGIFETVAGTGPTTGMLLLAMVAVTFSVSAIGWDQQTQDLRRRASVDDLTGLLSRSEFRTQADRMLETAHQGGQEVMLVMADLDYFKSVNDTHGHQAGDRALREFAVTLMQWLRPGEVAGRIGGEEFGLVLFADAPKSMTVRLQLLTEEYLTRRSGYEFDLPTASYGVTAREPEDTVSTMFIRADFALHMAKTAGRNQAVVYDAAQGHAHMLTERRHLRGSRRQTSTGSP